MILAYANADARATMSLSNTCSSVSEVMLALDLMIDIADNEAGASALYPASTVEAQSFALAYLHYKDYNLEVPSLLEKWIYRGMAALALSEATPEKDLLVALDVKRPKKRGRPETKAEKHKQIARNVEYLMSTGLTLEESAFTLAELENLHEMTVIKAYSKLKNQGYFEPLPFGPENGEENDDCPF